MFRHYNLYNKNWLKFNYFYFIITLIVIFIFIKEKKYEHKEAIYHNYQSKE